MCSFFSRNHDGTYFFLVCQFLYSSLYVAVTCLPGKTASQCRLLPRPAYTAIHPSGCPVPRCLSVWVLGHGKLKERSCQSLSHCGIHSIKCCGFISMKMTCSPLVSEAWGWDWRCHTSVCPLWPWLRPSLRQPWFRCPGARQQRALSWGLDA